jgi:hypothetical protein
MRLALAFAVVAVSAVMAQAPLPDAASFLAQARENLARSTQQQDRYAYKERRTELHLNPFGKMGSGATSLFEVTPAAEPNVTLRKLLERDGKRVTDGEVERVERRSRGRARSRVDDTVDVLTFTLDRRETYRGRDLIVINFEPKPGAKPQTREGRIAKALKGSVWVDEALREVVRAEATAIDDLSFGFGMVARLHKGAKLSMTRERVDDDVWLPTSIKFAGTGRALLFRKLTIDHSIEWFDYREVKQGS